MSRPGPTLVCNPAASVAVPPLLCLAAWVLLAGCSTPRPPTWEELPTTTTAAVMRPPPTAVVVRTGSAPGSSGKLIDRALAEFVATRARARGQSNASPLWSEAWSRALHTIDDAVQIAPVAQDLGAFVRARVTLEVEYDADLKRGVLLPTRLDARVRRTLSAVDESVQELRAANAPGTLAPTPRLEEGELVLRAPLSPMIVSSPFGRRADPFTGTPRYHAGVDLDAPEGSTVYAAASGIVVYAGPPGRYGRSVVVDHGDGVRSHYAHLSGIQARVGALVIEGDAIGFVGSTGRSTGPHLHFAVTNALGEFLDPVAVLDVPFHALNGQVVTRR